MRNRSEPGGKEDPLREKLIGLGERSHRKSYYPELQQRLGELERFKAFLDHSNDAVFLVQVPTGRIIDVTDASCRQLGRDKEELLELSIFHVSRLEESPHAKQLIGHSEERGRIRAVLDTELCRSDGSRFPVEVTLARKYFRESGPLVIAVARDITKRKHAEEELARSKEKYQTLAEVAPIGIFYIDPEGSIRYVNEKWREFAGYLLDDLPPEDFFWGLFPGNRRQILRKWREAAERNRPLVSEYLLNHPLKKEVWVVTRVMAEKSASGEILGYVGTLTDITDRKKAEEKLLRSEERRHKLQAEVEYAADVQRKLLPSGPLQVPGFEFAARCLPAYHVGGDFFDWQETGTGHLTLTLGDVMGKGMAAAMLMATVRASLRASSQAYPPAMALQQAEMALREDLIKSESFVTLFHARLNIARYSLTYVDCGHGYAFLVRNGSKVEELLPRGLPFGILPGQGFQEGEVQLEGGDTLVLFSDGLVDIMHELELADETLTTRLWSGRAEEIVDRLFAIVPSETNPPDDMTLMVIRCTGEDSKASP